MHPLTPIKTVVLLVVLLITYPLYHDLKYKRFQIIMLPKNHQYIRKKTGKLCHH